jgi:hypothetical protein
VYSQAINPVPVGITQTIAPGAKQIITIVGAVRLETGETLKVQASSTGAAFAVGGGLSALLIERINEDLTP